ncbi:NAD(P)H-hydrate epimerase [Desulfofundulus australicus DSM 11792]|jgi:NAD(P)H-hydrate epimerase|uniref:Bifunctional NAD(P)H-hydrate repair enzyme n=1 Tax=Desulfofundulus australicus DSM 11792 TaxID=1121425 RepID=A0A1M4THX1_9FIRM|nr:bifunctional ADP-dependent NAD(P)H-hydrate dehydratase/NAD(P)H-hydrate epimerase [Desulfofundulus australicus]SHE44102.1 NAD(P)H-hydrate epimerase [Desulfofundulus australicus DSM 11792]
MRVVTGGQMRDLDRAAMEEYGIPGLVLMENAGLAVVQVVRQLLGDVAGKRVAVFAGKGNNGGDGLVVARHLFNAGAEVKVLLLARPEEITGDAAVNLAIWQKMGQPVYPVVRGEDLNAVRLFLVGAHAVVDAIFGTGFKGAAREPAAGVIDAINASGKPVVAVDIPSGVEADTGQVHGPCVRATHTVTFALPKLGLVQEPGRSHVGELHVADISIPSFLLENGAPGRYLVTEKMVRDWLPPRPAWAHKGSCGRVLVVAGSRGMTGAACLAALGAARAGAGLVTLAVPAELQDVVAVKLTEIMTVGLPGTGEGTLARSARNEILDLVEKADVLAIGPGLSRHLETVALIRELLPAVRVPCVIDADGLNALAGDVQILSRISAPAIITPHEGEMARLLGCPPGEISSRRLKVAEEAAGNWGVVTLLKGAATLIACPGGTTYINPTGNPGLATGGSGDVLTGVIAGLLAQGMDAPRAAAAGAYLHGLAGDMAAREKGMRGFLAGDILELLPEAMARVECTCA